MLVINPESHLWKDFFIFFSSSLLILINRIPKEDLESQCREVETTHTLKTGKRPLSFLMCSQVDPRMACFSKCPHPLPSPCQPCRLALDRVLMMAVYFYITSEDFKRELGSQLIHYVLTVTNSPLPACWVCTPSLCSAGGWTRCVIHAREVFQPSCVLSPWEPFLNVQRMSL